MRLTLWFVRSEKPELSEILFEHPKLGERIARRGKGLFFADDDASFQWTAAVKALSQLAVGTRLGCARGDKGPFVLSGGKGSPAASLDYAIGKPTAWVADIFSDKASRNDSPRQIFKITNSGLKLPGPVEVQFARSLSEERSLRILLDNRELQSEGELIELFGKLGGTPPDGAAAAAFQKRSIFESSEFRAALERETRLALKETALMENLGISQALVRLQEQAWFAGDRGLAETVAELKSAMPPAHARYTDTPPSALATGRKLRVACLPMAVGTIVLFNGLRATAGIDIDLDFHHQSTTAILETQAQGDRYDYVVLSWGAARKLAPMRPRGASALMLLPRTSFDLLVPEGADHGALPAGKLLMAAEESGYPAQYFRQLVGAGKLPAASRVLDTNTAEFASQLGVETAYAIMGFPFSDIIATQLGLTLFEPGNALSRVGDNLLFALGRQEAAVREGLLQALRGVWFRLLEDEGLLRQEVRALASDRSYLKSLKRIGGLFALDA